MGCQNSTQNTVADRPVGRRVPVSTRSRQRRQTNGQARDHHVAASQLLGASVKEQRSESSFGSPTATTEPSPRECGAERNPLEPLHDDRSFSGTHSSISPDDHECVEEQQAPPPTLLAPSPVLTVEVDATRKHEINSKQQQEHTNHRQSSPPTIGATLHSARTTGACGMLESPQEPPFVFVSSKGDDEESWASFQSSNVEAPTEHFNQDNNPLCLPTSADASPAATAKEAIITTMNGNNNTPPCATGHQTHHRTQQQQGLDLSQRSSTSAGAALSAASSGSFLNSQGGDACLEPDHPLWWTDVLAEDDKQNGERGVLQAAMDYSYDVAEMEQQMSPISPKLEESVLSWAEELPELGEVDDESELGSSN